MKSSSLWKRLSLPVFLAGLLLACWPVGQHAWTWWNQRQLRARWNASAQAQAAQPAAASRAASGARASSSNQPVPSNVQPARDTRPWPPTRIVIKDIGLDVVTVGAADESSLRRGPGHLPRTGMPGEGNCVLAGHRNVYGSPFARINEVQPGALIELVTPRQTFRYRALTAKLVFETDLSILQPPPPTLPARLTLFTCTIPHSWQRIVLIAEAEQPGVEY